MPRELRRVEFVRKHFAENVKMRDALRRRAGAHRRHEALPEFGIDVLSRIDAKAVDAVLIDPIAENLDEAAHHARVFGHHIVEAAEVPHGRTLAVKRRVAAVVIIDRVVQPFGNLDVLLPRRHERRVGIVGAREFREVLLGLVGRGIAEESSIDLLARDSAAPRVGIVRTRAVRTGAHRALSVVDDVRRVIDHDIQVQLHAAGMNGLREGVHVRVGAEMRIDVRKIGDPVAVIAGGLVARRSLHRSILEDWGEPYRGRAERLNVVQTRNEALQISAVIKAFGSRIESRDQPSALETAAIIGRIAILEPVGQEEINDFIGRRPLAIIRRRLRTWFAP